MKILILGSGAYVTGKGMAETGTILTSVIQSANSSTMDIHVVSRSNDSKDRTLLAAEKANELLGTSVSVTFTASEGKETIGCLISWIRSSLTVLLSAYPIIFTMNLARSA